jgi:hypothetical protein
MWAPRHGRHIRHRNYHPVNGQVEWMNRMIKDDTVKRDHYDTHDRLRARLQLFVDACNQPTGSRPNGASSLRVHLQTLDRAVALFITHPTRHTLGASIF